MRERHAPSEFPPPVDPQAEFIKRGLDAEDDLIEVGVAIVGGGTAGLAARQPPAAAARRRSGAAGDARRGPGRGDREGQDLRRAHHVRRGHAPGAAAGAVPGPVARGLAQGAVRVRRGDQGSRLPAFPTRSARSRSRRRRTSRTTATRSISVAALARYQQRVAEEAGAYVLTETAATQLIVEDGAVVGVRSGDKGRGKDGEPLAQLRARHRHQGRGDRAGRGQLGPPDRRRDPRVRSRRRP